MRKMPVITASLAVFIFSLTLVMPAKAFYLNIPDFFKTLWSQVKAQDGGGVILVAPIEPTQPMQPIEPLQPIQQDQPKPQPLPPMPPQEPQPMPPQQPQPQPQPSQPQPTQPQNPDSSGWCNINGVQMPGACSLYNTGNGSGDNGASQIKGLQKGMKQMENSVKKFKILMLNAEKKGTVIPQEVKDNLSKLEGMFGAVKNAGSQEDLDNIDLSDMQDLAQSLEDARRDVIEAAQRLDNVKKGVKGMEQNVKMFEKQVAKLVKQKLTPPAEVADNLSKLKTMIAAIKNAKTWEEVENSGFEDMQDLMMGLDQNRQQLEMMARWPQTLKDLNRQVIEMERAVKRVKTAVKRLSAKGIDVTANLSQFEEAVNKMKSVRDDAKAKMAAGESEEAFDLLESDFFGQGEEVWENMRVIDTMSNLGKFVSDYKRSMTQSQSAIKSLAKKKIDTAELKEILSRVKEKGDGIVSLLKSSDKDTDAMINSLEEMESLRLEFSDKMEELTGDSGEMPWESGPDQFQQVKMPNSVTKYLPQKSSPAPAPSVAPSSGGMGL